VVLDSVSRADELDYKLIAGLMEDALYGGRVDNSSDLRVLRTCKMVSLCLPTLPFRSLTSSNMMLSSLARADVLKLYNREMLNRGGEVADRLRMPSEFSYDELVRWSSDLDDEDNPNLFGLPANIERAVQKSKSTAITSQLRSLSISGDSSLKFEREKWRTSLGPLIDVWGKLIGGERLRDVEKAPRGGQPVDVFVMFENETAAKLCLFVDSAITSLKKVIYGSDLLTPEISTVGNSLIKGEVPASWEKIWEGPEAALQYLQVLVGKKKALTSWAQRVSKGRLLDGPLNLSDLFNPGTFLNALRQQSARKLSLSLEETKLVSSWEKAKISGDFVVEADGIFIESAEVDRGVLIDVEATAPELARVPTLYLSFVAAKDAEPYRGSDVLKLPVYSSPSRENHFVDISIPVSRADEQDKWVLAGVALFLSSS
jgi:dynein heavy chain 2